MERTKETIKNFVSKAGHHDTSVHETVAPAVKHETVRPQQHEEMNTAIDKEVHQDHYHHTVQPVQDREVLPEKHTHQMGAVQEREYDNRDMDTDKRNLEREAAKYKDERVVQETTHTKSHAPVVAGEHVHHHVHEHVQPVVHKETVQPNVVHTTVPIHETHHKTAKHHETSALPAMTMEDFKKHGGSLTGNQEHHHKFDGHPDERRGILSSSNRERGNEYSTHGTGADGVGRAEGLSREGVHEGVGREGVGREGVEHIGNMDTRDRVENATGLGKGVSHTHARGDSGKGMHGSEYNNKLGESESEHLSKPTLMNKIAPSKDTTGEGPGFMK